MSEGPFYLAVAPCWSCGRPFSFNPHLVPSLPIDDRGQVSPRGDRKPICRTCATAANMHRKQAGLPLWNVSDEAYGPAEGLL